MILDRYHIYSSKLLPKKEYFVKGHRACQGCAMMLAVRHILKAVEGNCIIANATGCLEIVSSPFPTTAWGVPWIHVAFENAAAVASGIEAGLKILRKKGRLKDSNPVIFAFAGDGGTADIGLQALSGAMERGHNMIYVSFDNEAYMNTGIQRSSSTPTFASTTTSPAGTVIPGQVTEKKFVPEIMVAHNIPYVATANPSYPFDLFQKIKKAASIEGPKYIQVYSVCPTGWRSLPEDTIKIGRLAVETGFFPMYEVINGKYHITHDMKEVLPLSLYIKTQGRFRHVMKDKNLYEKAQQITLNRYNQIRRKAGLEDATLKK